MVRTEDGILRRLTKPALIFSLIVLVGALGYTYLENIPPLDGCAVYASDIRGSTGANIVAVRQRTGKLLAAPTPDTKLQAGDIIVALGTREQLTALSAMTH